MLPPIPISITPSLLVRSAIEGRDGAIDAITTGAKAGVFTGGTAEAWGAIGVAARTGAGPHDGLSAVGPRLSRNNSRVARRPRRWHRG